MTIQMRLFLIVAVVMAIVIFLLDVLYFFQVPKYWRRQLLPKWSRWPGSGFYLYVMWRSRGGR